MEKRLSVLCVVLALVGCGGGSGGTPPQPEPVLTGRVLPSGSGLTAPAPLSVPQLAASARREEPQCCDGEVIVWFAEGVTPENGVERINRALGTTLRVEALLTREGPAQLVGGPAEYGETGELIRALTELPLVRSAEPHFLYYVGQAPPVSLAPNDPVTKQYAWSFEMVRTTGAWAHTRGDPSVVVAVIDSGVGPSSDPHPDLQGQLLPGYDFVDGDTDASDVVGGTFHGTHVAGTIAAIANNATGVAGIAPGVSVLPIRAGNKEGRFPGMAIAQAIRWAAGLDVPGVPVNANPAHVINMSLGGPIANQLNQEAAQAALAAGAVLVAAAGNDSGPVGYPAGYPEVISVSSVGPTASLSSFSNFGPQIDVAAPGGEFTAYADMVWSTKYYPPTSAPAYAASAGTSMACPHVAAVAALALSANPALTPAQVRTVLTGTALDLGDPGRDSSFGFGLVDALAAVERALELGGSPPSVDPARLAARMPVLHLSTSQASAILRMTNLGDGTLSLQGVSVFSLEAGVRTPAPAWLQATIEQGSITSGQDGEIRVTANPGLAGAGSHQALLEVTSDGGRTSVPVFVVTDFVPDLGTVTVNAVDTDTGLVAASTTTSLANGYDFAFAELAPGSYFLMAVADVNGDGVATRSDEWQGAYPSADRVPITIVEGQTRSGIGIPVVQEGAAIRSGTGGGAINGVLGVLVRSEDTGLPIEGAQVTLGDGVRQMLTDARGLAVFTGIVGPQTVTVSAAGFNAETFANINASEIGFSLSPTQTGSAATFDVEVEVQGLFSGETAFVFTGFELHDPVDGDAVDPITTASVRGPAIVSVIVLDNTSGAAVAYGYGVIDEDLLAAANPAITVSTVAFPAGSSVTANVSVTDSNVDAFLVLPTVVGSTAEQMLHLGLAFASAPGPVSTPLVAFTELADWPASVLVFGLDTTNGGGSIRLFSDTVGDLVGAQLAANIPTPPSLATPTDGGTVAEGQSFSFSVPATAAFGQLRLTRTSDGFTWTFNFGPGASQVRIPAIGLLAAGAYEWQVSSIGAPSVTYETLTELPSNARDGFAALSFFATSPTFAVTVQ